MRRNRRSNPRSTPPNGTTPIATVMDVVPVGDYTHVLNQESQRRRRYRYRQNRSNHPSCVLGPSFFSNSTTPTTTSTPFMKFSSVVIWGILLVLAVFGQSLPKYHQDSMSLSPSLDPMIFDLENHTHNNKILYNHTNSHIIMDNNNNNKHDHLEDSQYHQRMEEEFERRKQLLVEKMRGQLDSMFEEGWELSIRRQEVNPNGSTNPQQQQQQQNQSCNAESCSIPTDDTKTMMAPISGSSTSNTARGHSKMQFTVPPELLQQQQQQQQQQQTDDGKVRFQFKVKVKRTES